MRASIGQQRRTVSVSVSLMHIGPHYNVHVDVAAVDIYKTTLY